jgi:hypothetical protein
MQFWHILLLVVFINSVSSTNVMHTELCNGKIVGVRKTLVNGLFSNYWNEYVLIEIPSKNYVCSIKTGYTYKWNEHIPYRNIIGYDVSVVTTEQYSHGIHTGTIDDPQTDTCLELRIGTMRNMPSDSVSLTPSPSSIIPNVLISNIRLAIVKITDIFKDKRNNTWAYGELPFDLVVGNSTIKFPKCSFIIDIPNNYSAGIRVYVTINQYAFPHNIEEYRNPINNVCRFIKIYEPEFMELINMVKNLNNETEIQYLVQLQNQQNSHFLCVYTPFLLICVVVVVCALHESHRRKDYQRIL